jgi:hypothetical protein
MAAGPAHVTQYSAASAACVNAPPDTATAAKPTQNACLLFTDTPPTLHSESVETSTGSTLASEPPEGKPEGQNSYPVMAIFGDVLELAIARTRLYTGFLPVFRRRGRVAEGGALLKRYTPKGYRRFESYRLRHYLCAHRLAYLALKCGAVPCAQSSQAEPVHFDQSIDRPHP